jgi:predicted dehydrogenase
MTLKFAIAGAGYIAGIHARAIQASGDAELVAVVEAYPEKAKAFCRKYGVPRQFGTVDDLLREKCADALVIGTPNFLHAPQALAALKKGLAVLVEKPMSMTVAEAVKILKASQISRAPLMIAHCWRFDQDVLWLKKHAGKLAPIIRTKSYGVHVRWGPSGWFTQKSLAGGGALADMGVHAIDTTRFLLGDPQPVSVYARIGTYYKDFDVDDTGVLLVNWDNGTVSYVESGWWQPHADGPEAATQLYGTKGFGQLFPTRLQLGKRLVNPGFIFPRPEHCPQGMYDAQMAYFIQCLKTNQTPSPGGVEGLVIMKIVDAAYKSALTGRVEMI